MKTVVASVGIGVVVAIIMARAENTSEGLLASILFVLFVAVIELIEVAERLKKIGAQMGADQRDDVGV